MKSRKERHTIHRPFLSKGEMNEIISLLKTNDFISGEQIAKQMEISRTSAWRKIEKLRNMGYEIISKKGKGYKLISKPDVPYPNEISLGTKIIGRNIIYFKSLSSTNAFAKKMIRKGAKEGTVIIAETQTAGRGRKDREWLSPPGGLWFSIILYPSLHPRKSNLIMMASSIAIADAIATLKLRPQIKWPNDILVNEKKVCGILMEVEAGMNEIIFAIVGIGINVYNELPSSLKKTATTLQQCTNKKISRITLFESILKNFDDYYVKLLQENYEDIRKKWLSFSHTTGKEVEIKEGNVTVRGKVIGIDGDGFLLVKDKKKIHRIVSGDVCYLQK